MLTSLNRLANCLPWRVSNRPSKQLLYMWLARDMRHLRGEIGLDAGCGDMGNRCYFRTSRYLGVEVDASRLEAALEKNRDERVSGIVCRIEDLPATYQADAVLCVQATGGKHNDLASLTALIDKLIALTKPGGSLIFNTGKKRLHDQFTARLNEAFSNVTIRRSIDLSAYGLPKHVPIAFSILLAYLVRAIPSMRRGSKFYFLCRNKRSRA